MRSVFADINTVAVPFSPQAYNAGAGIRSRGKGGHVAENFGGATFRLMRVRSAVILALSCALVGAALGVGLLVLFQRGLPAWSPASQGSAGSAKARIEALLRERDATKQRLEQISVELESAIEQYNETRSSMSVTATPVAP